MDASCIAGRVLAALTLTLALPLVSRAQQVEENTTVLSEEVAGRLDGYNYEEGPQSDLRFRGTPLALSARGTGEVEFQEGRSRVEVDVEQLPPPARLGPYATYVLWAVAPDGTANNVGAIETDDGDGELETSTPLPGFSLIVTAEPHFAVTAPSRAVVLQSTGEDVKGQKFFITGLKQRIAYDRLAPQTADMQKDVPSDLVQARYAVAIAEAAQAGQFAAQEFVRAQSLLAQAEKAQQRGSYSERREVPELARDAAQTAEDARRSAVVAAARAAADERAASQAAQAAAAAAAAEAEQGRRRAELAAEESAAQALLAARRDLVQRLNRVLPTRDTDRGIVAEISDVNFAVGKAALNDKAREALARFAGIVGVYPGMSFLVEGHTDTTGSYELNQALSLDRASSVRDYLVRQGVASSRIDVEGLGYSRPVASNETAEGRARNRRVEIVLKGDPVAAGS